MEGVLGQEGVSDKEEEMEGVDLEEGAGIDIIGRVHKIVDESIKERRSFFLRREKWPLWQDWEENIKERLFEEAIYLNNICKLKIQMVKTPKETSKTVFDDASLPKKRENNAVQNPEDHWQSHKIPKKPYDLH